MSDRKEKRTKIVALRLTEKEHQKVLNECSQTTTPEISQYIRRYLFEKKITVKHRNQSLDECMAELMLLRNEINVVGKNFNQAVKKLHSLHQISECKNWILTYESVNQELIKKISEINNRINQISDIWLQ